MVHAPVVGDVVRIQGLHANGEAYRWWNAVVEGRSNQEIVLVWPAGTRFGAPTAEGRKLMRTDCRMFFWPGGKLFTLVEQYGSEGLTEIAMDIAAAQGLRDGTCTYIDYELDVVMPVGRQPYVEDEDEFEDAVQLYGYTPEFQRDCRAAVDEALAVIRSWRPRGRPDAGLLQAIERTQESGR